MFFIERVFLRQSLLRLLEEEILVLLPVPVRTAISDKVSLLTVACVALLRL